jgi:uncharacterized membrane protein (UPF0127 family)
MRITDPARSITIADDCRPARTFWTRLRGLLGTQPLGAGQALLLEPCHSIHMFFMGYPIDALYLDAENRVLRVVPDLAPWRVGPTIRRARRVLELPAGHAARCGVQVGDRLAFDK